MYLITTKITFCIGFIVLHILFFRRLKKESTYTNVSKLSDPVEAAVCILANVLYHLDKVEVTLPTVVGVVFGAVFIESIFLMGWGILSLGWPFTYTVLIVYFTLKYLKNKNNNAPVV